MFKGLHLFIKVVQYHKTFHLSYCKRFYVENDFFLYNGGLALESVRFQRPMSVIKKNISSLIKDTQPIGPKRNPNPAQQVDWTKKSNFETA